MACLAVLLVVLSLSDAAITNTPQSVSACNGRYVNLKWTFDTANFFAAEWKINGSLMLQYAPIGNPQLNYYNGYTNATLIHVTNGEINITSLTTSNSGNYSCTVTYSSGSPLSFETEMMLTVYDMISTNLSCSYNQSVGKIDCSVIPVSILSVTVNGAVHSTSSLPISVTAGSAKYTVCMTGDAAECRNDGILPCVSIEGQSLLSTTAEYSTFSTNELTTNLHRAVELLSRLIKTTVTVDKTTEDVYSTTSLYEQSKITTQTTSVPNGDSGDKNLLLTTKVLTFSLCGTICFVSIITIVRFVHRTHHRSPHGDNKVSNTGLHILDNHVNNTKIYDTNIHCCGEKKTISEMTRTKQTLERNYSQMKFKNMYKGHDVCVSARTYYNDYQISPSTYSRSQDADLKGYVFYHGKI